MLQQIGHGYGCEWQLLRMLDHHRNYFEKLLKEQIPGLEGDIKWLDFPFNNNGINISEDVECQNLHFLEKSLLFQKKRKKRFNLIGINSKL